MRRRGSSTNFSLHSVNIILFTLHNFHPWIPCPCYWKSYLIHTHTREKVGGNFNFLILPQGQGAMQREIETSIKHQLRRKYSPSLYIHSTQDQCNASKIFFQTFETVLVLNSHTIFISCRYRYFHFVRTSTLRN